MSTIERKIYSYFPHQLAITCAIALLGSIFLALMSQVSCPLPFTPIPFTLQTLALFLLSGILGSAHALRSVICYLVQGTVGLPVFAGGLANPLWYLDAKAGFLVSFVVAALVIGKLIEAKPKASFTYLLFCLLIGQLSIFAIGMSWLALFVGVKMAFLFGVLPFVYGALVKISAAALMLYGVVTCKH